MLKQYQIQGLTFTEKDYENSLTVAEYKAVKQFVKIYEDYIGEQVSEERKAVLSFGSDFMLLTDGISLEEFAEFGGDKEGLKRMNDIIAVNLKKFPDAVNCIAALNEYSTKINSIKENFIAESTVIKSANGFDKLVTNLELLFRTYLDGEIDKINFNTTKTQETLEILAIGEDALEDFFDSMKILKESLPISMEILRTLSQTKTQNQTLTT